MKPGEEERLGGIFISYRRADSPGFAGRLYDSLRDRFGQDRVFRDVDAMDPGVDYTEEILQFIRSCDALIAVIGNHWLTARDPEGRNRLEDPDDLLRQELLTALEGEKIVIPVLVEGAVLPTRDQLPPELAPLLRRHALSVSDGRWDHDVGILVRTLEPLVGGPAQPAAAPGSDRPPLARRRPFWLVGLMAGATLLAAVGIGLWQSDREPGPETTSRDPPSTTAPPSPGVGALACAPDYFSGIAADRIATVEVGAPQVAVIRRDQSKSEPFSLVFVEEGRTLGALRVQFVPDGDFLRIESIVDGGCQPVREYLNPARPGSDRNVVPNFEGLHITLRGLILDLQFLVRAEIHVRLSRLVP